MSLPLSRSSMFASSSSDSWTSSWPDAAAFALGLAVAWWAGWNTGDLVWSLWLSSFVVGYATIVWMIAHPSLDLGITAWRERAAVGADPRSIIILWLLILACASLMLACFAMHFGA